MSNARDQMIRALKKSVVPQLRERGFSGSFPHFRRRRSDRIDLFTFQFDRNGGGFVIELGQCPPEVFTTHWGKQIQPEKVTAWDLPPSRRARIKPRVGSGTESWFRYDSVATEDEFRQLEESLLPFVAQAGRMFDDFDHIDKIDRAV